MQYLIIEDEGRARHLLHNLIQEEFPGAQGEEASTLLAGVNQIKKMKPQVVYLDIKLPGASGLDIGNYFTPDQMDFEIIFTTAYNEFAIDAFKTSAVDFLLKPIDPDELAEATQRALNKNEKKNLSQRLGILEKSLRQLSIKKIALEVPHGTLFIPHDDIVLFEADGMYTKVHLADAKKELISKPLKHFVEQLENNQFFFKTHRSYLINLKYIKEVKRTDGYYIIMDNGKLVPVSRENKSAFQHIIELTFKP
ncbi:LytR/AlgR family response regulator transcription factor [Nonlabens xiamenensis]|uniref:LytR/AlgR family response regulator transcription factor n=1 Tax=Nonlabens xiamenensis TaxID=2341043 RepID=UPI000F60812B|nr:LytTR family DNA-binding domain-containing protein [Nonlabens xiamenensis]